MYISSSLREREGVDGKIIFGGSTLFWIKIQKIIELQNIFFVCLEVIILDLVVDIIWNINSTHTPLLT